MKLYALNCSMWNSTRFLSVSIGLLLLTSLIESSSQLLVALACNLFGEESAIENLMRVIFGFACILLAIPIFADAVFILAQRVHPRCLTNLVQTEIATFLKRFGRKEKIGPENVKFNLWSVDKATQVCAVRVKTHKESSD